jgi:gliding motility-associated-like protein
MYLPHNDDIGKKITITLSTNDPPGKRCRPARVSFSLTVNAIPSAPQVASVTQPSCTNFSGSALLTGLPSDGRWTVTRNPDGAEVSGTGSSTTVANLQTGKYSFRVKSSSGCISGISDDVNIQSPPFVPTVRVNDPPPVCSPATVDLATSSITSGSTPNLMWSYWRNSSATQDYTSYHNATAGTYFIKGTASSGCFEIKPVRVTVTDKPQADAGPDQTLEFQFTTKLNAENPGKNETGSWSVSAGSGAFSDIMDSRATVSNLSLGNNVFLWTVNNHICPPAYDSVKIKVLDLVVPTLITPNMDSRNDYLKIPLNESTGKAALIIFNRRGIQVYSDPDYNNDWSGIDSKGNQLPEGTYFYVMKFENGRSVSGYVVVRR